MLLCRWLGQHRQNLSSVLFHLRSYFNPRCLQTYKTCQKARKRCREEWRENYTYNTSMRNAAWHKQRGQDWGQTQEIEKWKGKVEAKIVPAEMATPGWGCIPTAVGGPFIPLQHSRQRVWTHYAEWSPDSFLTSRWQGFRPELGNHFWTTVSDPKEERFKSAHSCWALNGVWAVSGLGLKGCTT